MIKKIQVEMILVIALAMVVLYYAILGPATVEWIFDEAPEAPEGSEQQNIEASFGEISDECSITFTLDEYCRGEYFQFTVQGKSERDYQVMYTNGPSDWILYDTVRTDLDGTATRKEWVNIAGTYRFYAQTSACTSNLSTIKVVECPEVESQLQQQDPFCVWLHIETWDGRLAPGAYEEWDAELTTGKYIVYYSAPWSAQNIKLKILKGDGIIYEGDASQDLFEFEVEGDSLYAISIENPSDISKDSYISLQKYFCTDEDLNYQPGMFS